MISVFFVAVLSQPTGLPRLEGNLLPNDRLLATEHLHEGDLIAPESFAEGACDVCLCGGGGRGGGHSRFEKIFGTITLNTRSPRGGAEHLFVPTGRAIDSAWPIAPFLSTKRTWLDFVPVLCYPPPPSPGKRPRSPPEHHCRLRLAIPWFKKPPYQFIAFKFSQFDGRGRGRGGSHTAGLHVVFRCFVCCPPAAIGRAVMGSNGRGHRLLIIDY